MILINTLMENNLFVNNLVQHGHIVLLRDLSDTGSSHFIFRNNIGAQCGSYPIIIEQVDHVKIYHNTFVDMLFTQSPKAFFCINFQNNTNYGYIANNIFYDCVCDGGRVYQIDIGSEYGFKGDYNLAFNSDNSRATWSTPFSSELHAIKNRDPHFISRPDNDFHLQNYSVCINTGGPLTITTGAGSGSTILVRDAAVFFDGRGNVEGDYIKVGANDSLKILKIDHHINSITLDRSIEWNDGDAVGLVYQGSAPDIGALAFREDENYNFDVKIQKPQDGSCIHGMVDIVPEVINEEFIRHITVFIDGLPQQKLREYPYKFTWNTAGISKGIHQIEFRAYGFHAASMLTQCDTLTLVVADDMITAPANLRFKKE